MQSDFKLNPLEKEFLDFSRGMLFFRGLLLIVLGFLMSRDFSAIVHLVTMVLGIVLLVDGGATLFGMVLNRKVRVSLVASSLLFILIGVLALTKPVEINTLVLVATGIWIAASAVQEIVFGIVAKKSIFSMLSGILSFIIGLLFVVSPWSGLAAIGMLLSLLLIVSGVATLTTGIVLGQATRE